MKSTGKDGEDPATQLLRPVACPHSMGWPPAAACVPVRFREQLAASSRWVCGLPRFPPTRRPLRASLRVVGLPWLFDSSRRRRYRRRHLPFRRPRFRHLQRGGRGDCRFRRLDASRAVRRQLHADHLPRRLLRLAGTDHRRCGPRRPRAVVADRTFPDPVQIVFQSLKRALHTALWLPCLWSCGCSSNRGRRRGSAHRASRSPIAAMRRS